MMYAATATRPLLLLLLYVW